MDTESQSNNEKRDEEVDRGIYMDEASISVSLTSFMTAVVIFFIGLLLTGNKDIQIRLRIPLVLLFLSAFGFLYSTLVYSNASGEIARLQKKKFHRQMAVANILSEYFGVYCLVFAVPIVVLGHSPDRILSILVLCISIASFMAYHFLGYSIVERYVSKKSPFVVMILIFVIVYTVTFWAFYIENYPIYYTSSLFNVLLILFISIYSLRKGEGR